MRIIMTKSTSLRSDRQFVLGFTHGRDIKRPSIRCRTTFSIRLFCAHIPRKPADAENIDAVRALIRTSTGSRSHRQRVAPATRETNQRVATKTGTPSHRVGQYPLCRRGFDCPDKKPILRTSASVSSNFSNLFFWREKWLVFCIAFA